VVAGSAVGLASCALVAGLGDYELAKGDASVDASVDAPAQDDSAAQGDAVLDGGAAQEASDASRLRDSDTGDSGSTPADAGEGGSEGDGPPVPPSDKGHVLCGNSACSIQQLQQCCEQLDADTCQSSFAICAGGVLAACDEAANCPLNQVCCVTSIGPAGLETSCRSSCQGTQGQSCRTSAECPGSAQPCVAWACAGGVAATCGGVGSSAGCH
jgi:hypothetical protein